MARPRSFDEQQVVATASECFRERGYAATSLDDISAATGLGKGSLYAAFGSKHALFLRTLGEYCCAAAHAQLADLLTGPDTEAVRRLSDYLIAHAVASAENADPGCMLARSVVELGDEDPAVLDLAGQTFEAIRAALADTLAAAQRAGDVDPNAAPHALAGVLLAVLRGTEALARAGTSRDELVEIAESAVAGLPRSRAVLADRL